MVAVVLVAGVAWLVVAALLVAVVACAGRAGREEDAHFGFAADEVPCPRPLRAAVRSAVGSAPHGTASA